MRRIPASIELELREVAKNIAIIIPCDEGFSETIGCSCETERARQWVLLRAAMCREHSSERKFVSNYQLPELSFGFTLPQESPRLPFRDTLQGAIVIMLFTLSKIGEKAARYGGEVPRDGSKWIDPPNTDIAVSMGSIADDAPRKEAASLLDAIAVRQAAWPKPTGLQLYQPQPSDVIVSTYPKAGTTLLQNMVYQIAVTTGGAPSNDPDGTHFKDITEAVPWVDYGPQFGVIENDTTPRLFKTHGRVDGFDLETASYIVCVRNPESYTASWMDFLFDVLTDHEVTDEAVREASFHLFARRKLLGLSDDDPKPLSSDDNIKPGPWFSHVNGWIDTPRPNVLVLFYEDIIRDLRKTALCVSKFMKRSLSEEALKTVVERCDRRAMAGDQRFNCGIEAKAFGISPTAEKARSESIEGFKSFKIKDEDRAIISKMMEVTFGVDSYAKLKSVILQRQQDCFPESAYGLE